MYPNTPSPLSNPSSLPQPRHKVFFHPDALRSMPDQSSFNPKSSNDSLPKNETIIAGDNYESLREAETRCVFSSFQILLRAKPWLVLVLFFKQNRIDRISSVTRFSDVFLHCCCRCVAGLGAHTHRQ